MCCEIHFVLVIMLLQSTANSFSQSDYVVGLTNQRERPYYVCTASSSSAKQKLREHVFQAAATATTPSRRMTPAPNSATSYTSQSTAPSASMTMYIVSVCSTVPRPPRLGSLGSASSVVQSEEGHVLLSPRRTTVHSRGDGPRPRYRCQAGRCHPCPQAKPKPSFSPTSA